MLYGAERKVVVALPRHYMNLELTFPPAAQPMQQKESPIAVPCLEA